MGMDFHVYAGPCAISPMCDIDTETQSPWDFQYDVLDEALMLDAELLERNNQALWIPNQDIEGIDVSPFCYDTEHPYREIDSEKEKELFKQQFAKELALIPNVRVSYIVYSYYS